MAHGVAPVRSVTNEDLGEPSRILRGLYEAIRAINLVFYRNFRSAVIDPAIWNTLIKPIQGWGFDAGDGMLEGTSGLQLGAI